MQLERRVERCLAGAIAHQFGKGFRTFTTSADNPFLQQETRVGWSTRVQRATLAADLVRSVDPLQDRLAGALRVSTSLPGGGSLSAELLGSRTNGRRDWAAYVYYRQDLDARSWVGTTVRTGAGARTVELDAGRRVQGEGLEYRVGVTASSFGEQDSGYGTLSANWHLRPATLEFYGSSPLRGTGHFAEVGVSGALVAIDGSWGATRRVDDSFVLARLGVPQEGVEVLLNNQPQGRTNARGELFLPEVGAFGRQDVSVDDRQLDMRYLLQSRRQTITPAYRSGVVVEFGGRRQRAVAGYAWRLRAGDRTPVAARAWSLSGPGGTLQVETGTAGDFYLEDVSPGRYSGSLTDAGETYACTVTIPDFAEVVHELADGIVCK